jgi:multiple sugar transport system permease protein
MVTFQSKYKYLTLAAFLGPSLIGMTLFVFLPILASLVLSFTDWDMLSEINWIGLANYKKALASTNEISALLNTLKFILGYLPSVLVISLGLAILLNKNIKGRVFYRAVYFVPVVSSWVAISLIWQWLLNPKYGLVNYGLSLFGIDGPGWLYDPNWAMTGIIMTSVWKDIGFVMVIYLAGLQEIPEYLYEAADLEGATAWDKFRHITLPMLKRTTFFVTTISLINSFQVFDQVWVMTQGGPANSTAVMMTQIYKNAFEYFQMGYASALSWILFALIFSVTIVRSLFQEKDEES